MQRRNRLIRIFVSSTFQDMSLERNAVQQIVVPRMTSFCAERGYHFEIVDLRWGISEAASQAHRTMSICLEELERSRQLSPKPCLMILLGQRYGWLPLPEWIEQDEAEQMLLTATDEEKAEFLRTYMFDRCALPARYVLHSQGDEHQLRRMMERCGDLAFHTKYLTSATEQEIQKGLLEHSELFNDVVAYSRILRGLPSDKEDVFIDKEHLAEVNNLREEVKKVTGERCRIEKELDYSEYNSEAYIQWFAEEVCQRLETIVAEEIDECALDDFEEEKLAQRFVVESAAGCYQPRANEVELTMERINAAGKGTISVVTGPSGAGLTSFAAHICRLVKATNKPLIYRFAGVGRMSSTTLLLLRSILNEVGADFADGDTEFELMAKLRIYLDDCEVKPTIVLDGLDGLPPEQWLLQAAWLPSPLPEGLHVLFTVDDDCPLDKLVNAGAVVIPLPSLDSERFMESFIQDMRLRHRLLTDEQISQVRRVYDEISTPLVSRPLTGIASQWTSEDKLTMDCHSIDGLIDTLLTNLINTGFHDREFVGLALGLLCYCRHGVNENELLHIIATDSDFFSRLKDNVHHSIEEEGEPQVPFIYWARMHHDIDFFLTLQQSMGGVTYTFANKTIKHSVERWLEKHYDNRHRVRSLAADYFYSHRGPRSCEELPYLLDKLGDTKRQEALLVSDEFMTAKCGADMVTDLILDYQNALSSPEKLSTLAVTDIEKRLGFLSKECSMIISYARYGVDFLMPMYDDYCRQSAAARSDDNGPLHSDMHIPSYSIYAATACGTSIVVCGTVQQTSDEYMICRVVDSRSGKTTAFTCLPLGFDSRHPEEARISADGNLVALFTINEEICWLWNLRTGITSKKKLDGLFEMSIADNGDIVYLDYNSLRTIDGEELFRFSDASASSFQDFISGNEKREVDISELMEMAAGNARRRALLSSDGKTLFIVLESQSHYFAFNMADHTCESRPVPRGGFEHIVGYDRASNRLLYRKEEDYTIYCCDLTNGTETPMPIELDDYVASAVLVRGRYLVCVMSSHLIYLDISTGKTYFCDERCEGAHVYSFDNGCNFISVGCYEVQKWSFSE